MSELKQDPGDHRTEAEWAADVANAAASRLDELRPELVRLMLQLQLLEKRADVHGLRTAANLLQHYQREIGLLVAQAGNVIGAVRIAEEAG